MVKRLKRWNGRQTTLQIGDETHYGVIIRVDEPALYSVPKQGYYFQTYEG